MSAEAGPIRILAVDDHPVVRQGIAGLVAVPSDMSLVAEATNGREAIQQFRAHAEESQHILFDKKCTHEADGTNRKYGPRQEMKLAKVDEFGGVLQTHGEQYMAGRAGI
jgi:DNA-binding NarL/FixJ family response regulator